MIEMNPAKTLSANDLYQQISDVRICNMNKAVLFDKNIHKQIMVTHGVSTCLIVIIHDPQSSLTLFTHLQSSRKILKQQEEFIEIFNKRGIPIKQLQVHLAGGIKSIYDSETAAKALKEFWQQQPVTLNVDLLLSRDGIAIENYKSFFDYMIKFIETEYEGKIKKSDIDSFLSNAINGIVYNLDRRNKRNYSNPALKDIHAKVEAAIENAVLSYLRKERVCDAQYINKHRLTIVQLARNSLNTSQKRLVIGFHDPHKSILNLVGFDIIKSQLFVINNNCDELIETAINNTDEKDLITSSTDLKFIELIGENKKENKISNLSKGFIISQAGDAQEQLVNRIAPITNTNQSRYAIFLKLVNEKKYNQALRTACKACKSNDQQIFELICILLEYKEALAISLDEKSATEGQAPIHYAALNENRELIDLLSIKGANTKLINKEGKTAEDILEDKRSQNTKSYA